MEDGSILSDPADPNLPFASGRVPGPAFQGACQPKPVTLLQFLQLKDDMENRFKELVQICREGNVSSEAPLLKAIDRNTDVTSSGLSQLTQHMHRLEALLYRHSAAISTEGERPSVRGPHREAGSALQLETRLEALQVHQSARFEEIVRVCTEANERHRQLDERLNDIQARVGSSTSARSSSGHLVTDQGTESAAQDCFFTPKLGTEIGERQLAKVAACSKDVSHLVQVLGWSNTEDQEEGPTSSPTSTGHYDPAVDKLRAYMQYVSMFVIMWNAAYLGVSQHVSMSLLWQGHEKPQWIIYGDITILIAFIVELLIRMSLDKSKFFRGKNFLWNAIDLLTTVSIFLEVISDVGNASFVRTLRLVRIAGSLRVLFAVRKLRMLRLLLRSLPRVVEPAIYTTGLLLFILYLGSLGLTQFVHNYVDHHPETAPLDSNLRDFYGSIWATMFTLLVAITGNGDWRQLVQPLSAISVSLVPVFVLIALFSVAGVSNLLVAVQVDRVIRDGHHDDRLQIRASLSSKESSLNALRRLLLDTRGCIHDVLFCKDAAKILRGPGITHLQNMGLELQMALGLLKMMDKEHSGIVNLEEFLCGLGQLLAENKSVHMATTMYECRRLGHQIQMVHEIVEAIAHQQLLGSLSADTGDDTGLRPELGRRSTAASRSTAGLRSAASRSTTGFKDCGP